MSITSKSSRVNRNEFLQALDAVRPGLSPKPLVEHANSFTFRNGQVQTYNDEIACRFRTKLPKDVSGIVASKSLLAYLNKIGDEYIDVKVDEEQKKFVILGRGKRTDMLTAFESVFPIDAVEKPRKEDWIPLSPRFGDSIGMVVECASKDATEGNVLSCVHVHPNFVEASDDVQWCRAKCRTKIAEPFLVKHHAVKHIVDLDMTEMAGTESWVHFRNPAGLVFSCRRWVNPYPNVDHLAEPGKGKKLTLPKELEADVNAVNVAASEDKDTNAVVVELKPGEFAVSGIGVTIKARHRKKCDYNGRPLAFMIQPAMLVQICKRERTCTIEKNLLRMTGDRWSYVTDLAEPVVVKKAAEQNIQAQEVEE